MQGDNQQGYVETAPQRINAKGSRRRGKIGIRKLFGKRKGKLGFTRSRIQDYVQFIIYC